MAQCASLIAPYVLDSRTCAFWIIDHHQRCRAAHFINESQPGRGFLVPLELWPPENPASRELLYTSIVTTKTVQPTRCRP